MELCLNCGASVPYSSFDLHEVHCSRFLYKCSCDEIIHIHSKSLHIEQFHSPHTCPYCNQIFEFWQKPFHDCPIKLIQCETCELSLTQDQYNHHLSICLMRTVQCIDCKKFFKVTEINNHLLKECMPRICDKQIKTRTQVKKSKNKGKKKKDWVSVKYIRKNDVPEVNNEDFDRQVAENLLEEIIFSELAEEDDY